MRRVRSFEGRSFLAYAFIDKLDLLFSLVLTETLLSFKTTILTHLFCYICMKAFMKVS